jgi:hypothetical protein
MGNANEPILTSKYTEEIEMKIELTDEQIAEYVKEVDQLLERRKKEGTLLATFDLIAGAALIFFLSGHNNKLPARWIFGAYDGSLPDGLLEKIQQAESDLREARDMLSDMDDLLDSVDDMRVALKKLNGQVDLALKKAKYKVEAAKAIQKDANEQIYREK